jgi:pimeloyl-ACP methyl ester carboxylesterase
VTSARHAVGGLRIIERPPLEDGPAQGRRVVLVHGAMDRATSFTRVMARLRDWTVVAYDRRGYAGSSAVAPSKRLADQVDDFVNVLDGRPVVALGHSLGATIVLAAAQTHPELVRAAVIWEAPMPWTPWWPATSAGGGALAGLDPPEQAERFMVRALGEGLWRRLPASTRSQRRAEGPALVADLGSLRAGPAFVPESISVPIIVGYGGRSGTHHRHSTEVIAARAPNAELVIIPGASHGAHLTHPGELADLLHQAAGRAASSGGTQATQRRPG